MKRHDGESDLSFYNRFAQHFFSAIKDAFTIPHDRELAYTYNPTSDCGPNSAIRMQVFLVDPQLAARGFRRLEIAVDNYNVDVETLLRVFSPGNRRFRFVSNDMPGGCALLIVANWQGYRVQLEIRHFGLTEPTDPAIADLTNKYMAMHPPPRRTVDIG